MNNLDIFTIIAQTAIVTGYHVRLEQKDYEGDSSVVGNMSKSHRTDRGLVLEVYPPGPDEAAVDEEEAGGRIDAMKEMTKLYICDRQRCKNCHDVCRHTTDIEHAKNADHERRFREEHEILIEIDGEETDDE